MVAGYVVKNGKGGYSETSGLNIASPKKEEKIQLGVDSQALNTAYNIAAFPAVGTNALNKYVSFNCLFTLACLDKSAQNKGEFNKANIRNIIARSQGDWGAGNNRVQSTFGQYDYFIDDVIIMSQPALSNRTGESFASKITFKVTEPYSMGLFLDTMLQGSKQGGYGNFREASYLLMIEFAGYTDDNKPNPPDPSLTRYYPIKFIDVHLKVTSAGSVYECEVIPYNEIAFREPISNSKSEISLQGDTVKSLLQTSLNNCLETYNSNIAKEKEMPSYDKVKVIFPKDFTDIGNLGSENEISKSIVFKDFNDNGSVKFPNHDQIFESNLQFYKNSNITIDKEKVFHWKQNTKIQDIIKDVVIRSDYISSQLTLSAVKVNTKGMLKWFRIETHVQDLDHNPVTNRQNREIIYRVVPYEVHISKLLPPGAIPKGYDTLKATVNRIYDYIYSGKNTEVISVDIDYNMGFFSKLSADAGGRSATENRNQVVGGLAKNPVEVVNKANNPIKNDVNTGDIAAGKTVRSDAAGSADAATMQVQNYREILTNEGDLVEIKMTIRGDPYYLPNSGFGNQIKQPKGDNIMEDGSMNYQSGEVDIVINFRTPVDLDPVTGLYKFTKTVDQFSGLFQIFEVESRFNQNKFTQVINAKRRRVQLQGSGEASVLLGTFNGR